METIIRLPLLYGEHGHEDVCARGCCQHKQQEANCNFLLNDRTLFDLFEPENASQRTPFTKESFEN